MALKDIWKDIVEGDFIDPKQINDVAHGVIDNENRTDELENEINGENGWNEQAKAAAVIAENAAKEAVSAKNQAVSNANTAAYNANIATNKANEAGESANAATEAKEVAEKARDDAETAKGFAEDAATKAENATEFLKNGALFANAIRGRLYGASVRADDVSPIEHELEVRVRSKNIMPFPYASKTATNYGGAGVDFIVNDDGSVLVNSSTGEASEKPLQFDLKRESDNNPMIVKEDVILSGTPVPAATGVKLQAICIQENGEVAYVSAGSSASVIKKGWKIKRIFIGIPAGFVCDNLLFKPQIEYGTVSTEFTLPSIDVEGTVVKRLGKNLFDVSKVVTYKAGSSNSNPGVSGYGIINNGDGTLTVYTHDTVTSAYSNVNANLRDVAPSLKVGETYTLNAKSIKTNGEKSGALRIYLLSAKVAWAFGKSLTITEEMLSSKVLWYVDNATGADQIATISDIQIEHGTAATEYEPYIEPVEAVADAEGNVELMSLAPSMTLTTDNAGAVIECSYNKDTNKVIENLVNAIISLGGNI